MASSFVTSFTVAVTADRRRDEQALLLERAGGEVVMFPLLKTEGEDYVALRRLTHELVEGPPSYLVANTGFGMRTWFELAEQWGLKEALVASLHKGTTIAARGAKALGELRKAGLDAWYKAPGETLEEVVRRLLEEDLSGATVVVQLHGLPSSDVVEQLEIAGATVSCAPVYKMQGGGDSVANGLLDAIFGGGVDAVTFTAAPQVHALAHAARERGQLGRLLDAFNSGNVVAACIGQVCATAARLEGVREPLVPEHPRLGSLANALGTHYALMAAQRGPGATAGPGGNNPALEG